MATDFVFRFEAVFHTPDAPECNELTHKCVKGIINTMKDCNNPDVEQYEMSEMLIKNKALRKDLKRLVKLMEGEVAVVQTPTERASSQTILDEAVVLVKGLKDLQKKDSLSADEIKLFCTNMVDVIKHVLDIVTATDKWTMGIATGYIDKIIQQMIDAVKLYKQLGTLETSELTVLINEGGSLATSVARFCENRATIYSDQTKRLRMDALARQVINQFNEFVGYMRGLRGDKQVIADLKNNLLELKAMLNDPAQFSTSIDIVHQDNLDEAYDEYVKSINDPSVSKDKAEEAALALLENIECRAEAGQKSDDPRKAKAGTVLLSQINNSRSSSDRKSMVESARSLAEKMDKMKLVCDSLDPIDTTVSRDMDDVTDKLLQDLCGKLDEL